MAHTAYQKTHKVTLGLEPIDINADVFVGDAWSMSKAHHAAIIFNVGVLASDVVATILQGHKIHPIVACTLGGAEAGNFGIAGDYAAMFTIGLQLVVHGSTGNDEIYTVDVAAATYAAGVTTIEVDEAVASAVADGFLTLVKAFVPAKTTTFTTVIDVCVAIIEVDASELDVANGYESIVVQIAAVGGNAGFVGAAVHRWPLRVEPPAYLT